MMMLVIVLKLICADVVKGLLDGMASGEGLSSLTGLNHFAFAFMLYLYCVLVLSWLPLVPHEAGSFKNWEPMRWVIVTLR